MLRDAAGILHSDEDSTMSAKLASLVESLGGSDAAEARTLTVALGTLIGSSTAATGGASRARISRTELPWGIPRVFQLLARRRPIALLVQDLHLAEATLLQLIRL